VGSMLAVVLMSGCVTSGQGDKMREDISLLSKRMETVEIRLNDQMARLRKVLDEATGLLERNSADLGSKVARDESDIAALAGKIEEAKHLLDEMQKRLASMEETQQKTTQQQQKIIDRVAPSMPEDKEALWKEAQTRLSGACARRPAASCGPSSSAFPQTRAPLRPSCRSGSPWPRSSSMAWRWRSTWP